MEKEKLITVASSLGMFYVIPLLGKPSLLLDTRLLVIFAIVSLLFLSQPVLKLADTSGANKKNIDMFFFTLGMTASQVILMLDLAYWKTAPWVFSASVFTYVGFFMMVGGLVFRIWSIRTLGHFFSVRVEFQADHEIIKVGPYKILRHPSYLGAYAVVIGIALFLQSTVGFVAAFVCMGLVYWYRISIEERELCKQFGDRYREYQMQTYRLIPFVW